MGKDGSSGEHKFEHVKSALAVGVETPWGILPEKVSHWDDDIKVLQNKMTIEICKPEEGLNIANVSGLWPVFGNPPQCRVHCPSSSQIGLELRWEIGMGKWCL